MMSCAVLIEYRGWVRSLAEEHACLRTSGSMRALTIASSPLRGYGLACLSAHACQYRIVSAFNGGVEPIRQAWLEDTHDWRTHTTFE